MRIPLKTGMTRYSKKLTDKEEKQHHTASKTKKHAVTLLTIKEHDKELKQWKSKDLKTVSQNASSD